MKKYFSLILVLLLIVTLTGCGNKKEAINMSTEEIIDSLYKGIDKDDLPKLENTKITNENLSYYLGIDSLDYIEGTASEPLMSSIPHSVVVVKVKNNVDTEKVKQQIKELADPRKWICVEAEQVIVEAKDDIIVLIMADSDLAKQLQTNFNKLGKS